MTKIYAKISERDSEQLNNKAKVINNGRTDGCYFYVGSNFVDISNPHHQLSIISQKEELEWFLEGREFSFFTGGGID